MVNAISGNHNPCGATIYSSIAGDAWYRAQLMLQDQKIGHYMHVPQRAVFFSQLFGSFIGIPINYSVIRWVVKTKADYLNGSKTDPTHQWTGQSLSSTLTTSVQYVLIVSIGIQPSASPLLTLNLRAPNAFSKNLYSTPSPTASWSAQ